MNPLKQLLLILAVPLFSFTTLHKYYISVTQIDYVQDKQSLQITSRIFIDDLEKLLRERYDETIILAGKNESSTADLYIEKYLTEKIQIKVNGKEVKLLYIGKEYDTDLVKCYLEVENIKKIESLEISNKVLFDVFDGQQNIVKTNIYSKQKSVILIPQKDSALLKFN
ncbi:DUF6702 family protein [Mariniflexile sp.]|uniref:DUF6702 family protein n=1 Tax=Mariniflexile sp. TaxID=1979402 RepID=UPI0040486530